MLCTSTPHDLDPHGLDEIRLILQDVSGAFRPNVLTALIGETGAGKTTLSAPAVLFCNIVTLSCYSLLACGQLTKPSCTCSAHLLIRRLHMPCPPLAL